MPIARRHKSIDHLGGTLGLVVAIATLGVGSSALAQNPPPEASPSKVAPLHPSGLTPEANPSVQPAQVAGAAPPIQSAEPQQPPNLPPPVAPAPPSDASVVPARTAAAAPARTPRAPTPTAPSASTSSSYAWPETTVDPESDNERDARFRRQKLKGRTVLGLRLGMELATGGKPSISGPREGENPWSQTDAVTDVQSRGVFGLDFGFRPIPELSVGPYGRFTIMDPSDSSYGGSLGGQLLIYPFPTSSHVFWCGLGAGYQWLMFSEGAFRGLEVTPQIGADLGASDQFAIGPYLDFTIANYTSSVCDDCSGTNGWLSAGLRIAWL